MTQPLRVNYSYFGLLVFDFTVQVKKPECFLTLKVTYYTTRYECD